MKRTIVILIVAAVTAGVFAASARTAPEPAIVSPSWQLEFEHGKLSPILVTLPGEATPKLFWYMTYTVTNNTGEDQIFVPSFTLYTDTGQTLRSGRTSTAVYDAVKTLLNDPLLKNSASMAGKILQGDDNAKEGVAIWPDFDPDAGSVDVFIGGLSGETARVKLPHPIKVKETDLSGKTRTVEVDTVVLSRMLQLTYSIPGEAAGRLRATVTLEQSKWVMR